MKNHLQAALDSIRESENTAIAARRAKTCKKRWGLLIAGHAAASRAVAEAQCGGHTPVVERARGVQLTHEVGLTQMAQFGCKGGVPLSGKRQWR